MTSAQQSCSYIWLFIPLIKCCVDLQGHKQDHGTSFLSRNKRFEKNFLSKKLPVQDGHKALQRWQLRLFKCHSNWEGGPRLTNQNPRLPSHISSQSHLTGHSGTEVVASALQGLSMNSYCSTIFWSYAVIARISKLKIFDFNNPTLTVSSGSGSAPVYTGTVFE
jgi:hypothetical protein